jgi:intein/homing endonuclease
MEQNLSGLNNYRTLTKREKLIFLAGVFEGEGSFGFWGKENKNNRYFRIQVRMTDEDIVVRFVDFFKLGHVNSYTPKKDNLKKSWKWTIAGDKAMEVMLQMAPYLGIRRKEKFEQCYQSFKQLPHLRKSYLTQLIKQSPTKTLQQN